MKRPTKGELERALKRAVRRHGHDYNCSSARGSDNDCTCGWTEVKKMAADLTSNSHSEPT